MKDNEILKKAIEKAMLNGYEFTISCDPIKPLFTNFEKLLEECTFENGRIYMNYHEYISYMEIIFSHNFAKAFFGNDEYVYRSKPFKKGQLSAGGGLISGSKIEPEWKYRLQEMVLEENPFKYLQDFL